MNSNNFKIREFITYHPVVIFIYFVAVLGVTMSVQNLSVLAASLTWGFIFSTYTGGVKDLKKNVVITLLVTAFAAAFNTLFSHQGETILFYVNANGITVEAAIFGAYAGLMLSSVIIWFGCFNKIVDSEMTMYVFSKISPVTGLMISMIFRYIPLLKNRYEEISMGQKCLGMDKDAGLIEKIRLIVKKVSILISWTLESSLETADSMAARGYGLKGRTSFNLYKWQKRDGIFTAVLLIITAGVIAGTTSEFGRIIFYPNCRIIGSPAEIIIEIAAMSILAVIPLAIEIIGEYRWRKLESKI